MSIMTWHTRLSFPFNQSMGVEPSYLCAVEEIAELSAVMSVHAKAPRTGYRYAHLRFPDGQNVGFLPADSVLELQPVPVRSSGMEERSLRTYAEDPHLTQRAICELEPPAAVQREVERNDDPFCSLVDQHGVPSTWSGRRSPLPMLIHAYRWLNVPRPTSCPEMRTS